MNRATRFGPGLLVTAAFVGPGTIATASVAGARFGVVLLWAVLFAVAASLVLQEMAARLGVVTGAGLGEALRRGFDAPLPRRLAALLVVAAVGAGNAAFQAGNVTGAALGLAELTDTPRLLWVAGVAIGASALLATGRYRAIQSVLMALVAAMGALFVATAWLAQPDWGALAAAALRPALPEGSLLTVVALLGTTVVPYNLFLHASAAARAWRDAEPRRAIAAARRDAAVAIALGGAITASIVVAAAEAFAPGSEIASASAMARQLEPSVGPAARSCFLVGLFAAGLTSAITAPLAAAYAVAGCLGWPAELRDRRLRAVWAAVVALGALGAALGRHPVAAIVAAQALNGLLLPLLAGFLVYAVNRERLLGRWRNGPWANALAALVLAVMIALGGVQLWRLVQ